MDRKKQQTVIYGLCVHGRTDRLSATLRNAYLRGREGMKNAWKGGPEFWAWKAGHDQFKRKREGRI